MVRLNMTNVVEEEAWEIVSHGSEGWEMADYPMLPSSPSVNSSDEGEKRALFEAASPPCYTLAVVSRERKLRKEEAQLAQEMFGHPCAISEELMKNRHTPQHIKTRNGKVYQTMPRAGHARV